MYVRRFTPPGAAAPSGGGETQVSREGANSPAWRDNRRELFFRSSVTGAPMAVDVQSTPTAFQAGVPKRLFSTPPVPLAVTADGQRFLVSMPPAQTAQFLITVILNWEAALKR